MIPIRRHLIPTLLALLFGVALVYVLIDGLPTLIAYWQAPGSRLDYQATVVLPSVE